MRIGPFRIGLPVPTSWWIALTAVFSGSLWSILWRLLVITVGLGGLFYLLVANITVGLSFLAATALGIILSDNIRMFIGDIYYGRFRWLG